MGADRRAGAQEANAIVLDYIHHHPQQVIVCSSLVTCHTERQLRGKGYKAVEARELYARAINRSGLVKFVGPACHDELAELKIRNIELSSENLPGFLAVSHSILAQNILVGGFYGHFFVVFKKTGLVIYPHDDCGYGAFDNEPGASRGFFSRVDPERFQIAIESDQRLSPGTFSDELAR